MLIQSLIDIIEAIENNFQCEIENYEGMIAILQFVFTIAQFLFIIQREHVSFEKLSSVLLIHITVTNLIVWMKNILLETTNEYFGLKLNTILFENQFYPVQLQSQF